jgi:hypothetical protein
MRWVLRWRFALLACAAGCSATQQTDGTEGTGGSIPVGNGGTGGSVPVGTGGTGGSIPVGTGGTGGTAPVDSGAPFTDPTLLARAATVVGSCMGDDGANRVLWQMWNEDFIPQMWGKYGRQAPCLATSGGGCAAAKACLGYEVAIDDAGCTTFCSGTAVTVCDYPDRITFDCGKFGLACDPIALCVDAPASTCDASTAAQCGADGKPQYCDRGVLRDGVRCADVGLVCAEGRCVGRGDACVDTAVATQGVVQPAGIGCVGQNLDACVGGYRETISCAGIAPGFSCQSAGGAFFCGLAAECVPPDLPGIVIPTPMTCEGTTLVLCNAGRIERVDCAALGFTGCDAISTKGCTPGWLG